MRILLVEDQLQQAQYTQKALQEGGHTVDHAAEGRTGLFMATSENYDAIVLDRMLPLVDGLAILRTLRASDNKTPILLLSALGEPDDRVEGLRAGADDYLSKPFHSAELLARIEVITRRSQMASTPDSSKLQLADLELDRLARTVHRAGKLIDLQPREYQLLEFLLRHAGQVVTRTMLLEGVWNYHFDPNTNVIDVHMSKLRAKIDGDHPRPLLHTVRGAGYRMGEK